MSLEKEFLVFLNDERIITYTNSDISVNMFNHLNLSRFRLDIIL